MKIVILGSGHVATQLGLAIHSIQENILQVYSPNLANAATLAKLVSAEPVNDLSQINLHADLYIISVKDDAIEAVAKQLKGVSGLVVHTAGTVDISAVASYTSNAGVFYPLQTFSKHKPVNFKEIPIFLETSQSGAMPVIENLARQLSSKVYQIDGAKRKILHLAAVFACNFTNHLYALADGILTENDLSFDMIKPLIAETNSKILNHRPKDVQTGPASRNDVQTMEAQKKILKDRPELLHIYEMLSDSIKLTLK